MIERKKQEYKIIHDFTDAHYWHKRFRIALWGGVAGWLVAAFLAGALIAHLNDLI